MHLLVGLFISILNFGIPDEVIQTQISQSRQIGELSKNIKIESRHLGYQLQYRVYTPAGYQNLSNLPVIYLTDGQWYISRGQMVAILDGLISQQKIKPIIAVFIDNRDPDNLSRIRRNGQFLCNETYVKFVSQELVPYIDKTYKTSIDAENRGIMGISFGGLNAAYFGINANATFGLIGMQSPALHPCPNIYKSYESQATLPLKIFLSTGVKNDTEIGTRQLKNILLKKGYAMDYHEVEEEHNWNNWKPLIDDALVYFFNMNVD